jgi:PAS domain S-box-containing protein
MDVNEPTRDELLAEVARLRQRVRELEEADVARRKTEDALVRQALVLQSILESIGDGVAAADNLGQFFIVNSAARRISGIGEDVNRDSRGGTYCIFRPDKTTPYETDELPIVRAISGESVDQELQYLHNSSLPPEGRWLNSTARPLRDSQGNLLGGVVVFRDVTQQQQKEEALRTSEERFRSFMDNSSAVAFMKDDAGRFVYYNLPHCEFFNHGETEWLGKTVFDVYPREIAQQLHDHDLAVIHADRPMESYEVVPAPDGAPHDWLVFKFPVRGPGGERFVGGVAIDITTRRQAERALRESEERFRELAENIRHVFWVSDANVSKLHYLSPAFETIWGWTCQSVYDNPEAWMDAIHADDRVRVESAMAQNRERFNEEYRIVRPDGSLRWIWDRAFPVYDAAGKLRRIVGIAEDITERKRAELALRESEERFRSLSACSPVGIFQTDAEGRLVYINPRCEVITGLSLPVVEGHKWTAQIHPDDHGRITSEWAIAASTGRSVCFEYRFRVASEDYAWVHVRTAPIVTADGAISGHIGTFEDVTDRRLAQDQIKEYAQRLQALSRRLLEVQEQERRHLARELHDEIGQLLTGLKFTLEMIRRDPGADNRPMLAEAQTLVRDLTARVRDLSLHLRPTMLDDLGLLPALLWLIERFTAQTQVVVDFEKSGVDRRFSPEVETAAYRIAQEALTNVARHAQVRRAALRVWLDEEQLHVQVEDEGVGFDTDAEQAGAKSSGLSGMHERAILLGGRLRIEAAPGHGTCVLACLPVSTGTNGQHAAAGVLSRDGLA